MHHAYSNTVLEEHLSVTSTLAGHCSARSILKSALQCEAQALLQTLLATYHRAPLAWPGCGQLHCVDSSIEGTGLAGSLMLKGKAYTMSRCHDDHEGHLFLTINKGRILQRQLDCDVPHLARGRSP